MKTRFSDCVLTSGNRKLMLCVGYYGLYIPLDLVVLDDEFLFEDLDGVEGSRSLLFCQHDLAKVSFSENRKEIKVFQANLAGFGDLFGGRGSWHRFDMSRDLLVSIVWLRLLWNG